MAYLNGNPVFISGNIELGYNESYAAGQKAEYDRFWANFKKGIDDRNTWECAFAGAGWNDDTFYPPFDIVPTGGSSFMFRFFHFNGDLVERLKECGVKLDCSKITDFYYTFYLANFSHIGEIDTRSATRMQSIFGECYNLVTVDKLILRDDGSQQFISPFGYDANLKNLTIEGVIGQNGFSVGDCNKLTHDSLMNIIYALKDYAGTGTTYTVTLGATNLAKLTDAEKAIATSKGWTLA